MKAKAKAKTKTKQIIWAIILTLGLIIFFATGYKSVKPVIVERVSVHVGSYCNFEGDIYLNKK